MKEKRQKPKKQDDLDTETTFADMNVDGFSWYDPERKKNGGKKSEKIYLSRAEKWAMFKAGFSVVLPFVIGVAGVGLILYAIMALWVG